MSNLISTVPKKPSQVSAAQEQANRMLKTASAMIEESHSVDLLTSMLAGRDVKRRRGEILKATTQSAIALQTKAMAAGREVTELRIDMQQQIEASQLLLDHHQQMDGHAVSADNQFMAQAQRSLEEKNRQLRALNAMEGDPELIAEVQRHITAVFQSNVEQMLARTIRPR
jgi:hypothetical protein